MIKVILIAFVLISLNSYAQGSIKDVDSLANKTIPLKLSPSKIDTYFKISKGYFNFDMEKSKVYNDSVLILSKKINYTKGYANYFQVKGYLLLVNGKSHEANKFANKAIEINKKYKDTIRYLESIWLLSECYASDGKKKEAIDVLEKTLIEVRNTDNKFLVRKCEIYQALAFHYASFNKYKSLLYLNEAITILKKYIKNDKYKQLETRALFINCYFTMSELFIEMEQYDKAMYYFNLFKEKEIRSPEYMHTVYLYTLAKIHCGLKNYNTALNLNKRAEQSALKVKDKANLIKCFTVFSKIYYGKKDYQNAIKYAKKSMLQQPEKKDQFDALQSLGKSYFAEGNFSQALNYQTQALKSFEENFGFSIYQDISSTHYALKDFKKATDYYKIFSDGKTKQIIDDNNKNVAELQNKFELEERNSQIKKSTLIRKQQSQKLENNKALLKTITVSLVVTFLLLGLSFYLFKKYKKNNLLLSEKNNLIEINNKTLKDSEVSLSKALLQKEILLKEVHHRVKNNLQLVTSLLNLQSRKLNSKEVDTFVEKSRSRIDAVALIHQNLYQSENFININFHSYITQLIDNIKRTVEDEADSNINFIINLCEVDFDIDKLIPLGLIINEAVNNSLKYAFKDYTEGIISITLKDIGNNNYCLTIADNGSGISNLTENNSLGIRLINLLTAQINGKIEANYSNGVSYTICFNN